MKAHTTHLIASRLDRFDNFDSFVGLIPKEPCHKCGQSIWYVDEAPSTWVCPYCANTISVIDDELVQEIDVLMRSNRKDEFQALQNSIIPRINPEIRKILARNRANN